MWIYLLYTGISIVFIYTVFRIINIQINIFVSSKWIRREQAVFNQVSHDFKYDDWPNIMLLLPVLREERELPGLLNHILTIKYPPGKLHAIVITTEREHFECNDPNCENVTTIEFAKELVEKLDYEIGSQFFVHIHYPRINGNKASQLNYAVSMFEQLYPTIMDNNTYIGVYDADSRPDISTIAYIGWNASTTLAEFGEMPPAYQQVSLYIKNYLKLRKGIEGILLKLEGFYQTRWSLGYELPNYLRQDYLLSRSRINPILAFFGSRMCYMIGHGCFIRKDILSSVGGFPTYSPTEDISLGYILSYLKYPIRPVPFFDFCEVPESMIILFNQSKVWFATVASVYSTIKYIRMNKFHFEWFRVSYLTIQRTIMNAAWAIGGVLVLSSIIFSMYLPYYQFIFLIFGIIIGLLYTVLGILSTLNVLRSLLECVHQKAYVDIIYSIFNNSELPLYLALSPIKAITNCIGPMLFFLDLIIAKFMSVTPSYKKTERAKL